MLWPTGLYKQKDGHSLMGSAVIQCILDPCRDSSHWWQSSSRVAMWAQRCPACGGPWPRPVTKWQLLPHRHVRRREEKWPAWAQAALPSPLKCEHVNSWMLCWQCPSQKPLCGLFSFCLCFPIQEKASVTTAADSFSDLVPSVPDITFVCCQSGKNNDLPAHFSSVDYVWVGEGKGERFFN